MELLDRYLQAVRFWLPNAQQDDIIAELRDDLSSQIEERGPSLGRTLNEDELVALLQQNGHPLRVAARYLPQQSLIGPTFFPIYKVVLKSVALFYLLPSFLVWIGLVLFAPSYHSQNTALTALRGYAGMWTNTFVLFGITTLAFAIVERFQSKINVLQKWDPRKLPAVVRNKDRVSHLETIFELLFSILFVFGWLALPQIVHAMFAPISGILVAAPALNIYFWLILIPTFLGMAQQLINLFRPQWTWLRPSGRLVSTVITLGIVASVLRIYPYYAVSSGLPASDAKNAAYYTKLALTLNQILQWSLICFVIALVIAVIVFTVQTVQVFRKYRSGPHSRTSIQISQVL
jgi:hypothetical protein